MYQPQQYAATVPGWYIIVPLHYTTAVNIRMFNKWKYKKASWIRTRDVTVNALRVVSLSM